MAKTVLIVDDDPASLRLYRLILEHGGLEVAEARNGLEALRRIFEEQPDLVILDIRLPLLSGLEVIREVRNSLALQDLPIMVVTAVASADFRRRCHDAGADVFLVKPISVLPFMETVRACLSPAGLRRRHG